MDLNTKDISHLLMMPEKEVQQLVKNKELPFQIIHDKVVFNKHHIIEWALGRNLPLNIAGHKKFSEYHIETVNTLLNKDSFHYKCDLNESSYIEQIVSKIKFEKKVDKEILNIIKKIEETRNKS